MNLTLDLETCTILVRIFNPPQNPDWSYAVLISRLTGEVLRLTIPELTEGLERAARWQRQR